MAPAVAQADDNLALPENGGEVHVSSERSAYPASAINNGERDGGVARGWQGFWNDATNGVVPDWAEVRWDAPQRIDRIVVRIPIGTPALPAGDRELGSARIQYWDGAAARYADVVDANSGDNPVLDWYAETVEDPGQTRTFTFPSITTTRVRVLIEGSAADGNSWLDEIEAYGAGCIDGNLALPSAGGEAETSSAHYAFPTYTINDGLHGSGFNFWNDGTPFDWPDWAGIRWATPQELTRLVVRIPISQAGYPVGERTLRRARVQWWDAAGSSWTDVVDARGAPNPILDWESEPVADPGQVRRFSFAPIVTTRVRVVIEDGTTDGWSWLDEIEAYGAGCPNPNLARPFHGGTASSSSELSGMFPTGSLNDGVRQGATSTYGYWADATNGVFPDWAQIAWDDPQTIGRLVLRLPVGGPDVPGNRTMREARVQYRDAVTSRWVDLPSTRGAPNPILDWESNTVADDSQIRRFAFTPMTTDAVRLVVEQGSDDGWSWLEEIEAYAR